MVLLMSEGGNRRIQKKKNSFLGIPFYGHVSI